MGKLRGRIIDRNRYAKRYPFVKGPKRYSYMGDDDLIIELGTIAFNDESEKTFTFERQFADTDFTVMAMPRDTGGANDAQVSLMVDGSTVDRSFVKILASHKFTGQVDVLAIKVG